MNVDECSGMMSVCVSAIRASRAKLQRLEKETRELEKSIEGLRHYQAKCSELEKMNKKLQNQAHTGQREKIRLKEEVQGVRAKLTRMEKQQSEMKSQEERLEDIDGASKKMMVSLFQLFQNETLNVEGTCMLVSLLDICMYCSTASISMCFSF